MDTGPISLFQRLGLPDFKKLRDQRPSQRIAAVGDKLLKGISTERPRVPDDKLLFNRESINATKNPLAKLFRFIMYKQRITPDDYRTSAIRYGQALGKTGAEMTTALSNARKAINAENLTVMQLERNLLFADYDILDLSLTIQNHTTGEITEYSLSDIANMQRNSLGELKGHFEESPSEYGSDGSDDPDEA